MGADTGLLVFFERKSNLFCYDIVFLGDYDEKLTFVITNST